MVDYIYMLLPVELYDHVYSMLLRGASMIGSEFETDSIIYLAYACWTVVCVLHVMCIYIYGVLMYCNSLSGSTRLRFLRNISFREMVGAGQVRRSVAPEIEKDLDDLIKLAGLLMCMLVCLTQLFAGNKLIISLR